MIGKLLSKGLLKDVGNVLQVLKDNKGRFSSKRTVAGAIIGIAASDFGIRGELHWMQLVLCGIAAIIVVLAPKLEKEVKDEYPESK